MPRFFYIITLFYGFSIMTFADELDTNANLQFIQKYEAIEEYEKDIATRTSLSRALANCSIMAPGSAGVRVMFSNAIEPAYEK